MPKNDLFDIEIREFSAVPDGAHEGANAVLMKRRDSEDPPAPEPGQPIQKRMASVLTGITDGHQHGIEMWGDGHCSVSYSKGKTDPTDHSHAIAKGPDGTFVLGMTGGHTHTIDQADMAQALLALVNKGDDPMAPTAEELQAQVDRLTKIVALTPEHRAHFDTLDETSQDDFLSKAAADRDAAIEVAKSADPVAYTTDAGMEIRKSAGDVVIAMAKQADATARENATLRKQAEQTALEKRATDELPNLGGTVQVRAAILSAIDGIEDEDVRKAAHERLRAGSESLGKVFEPQGHGGAGEPVDGSAEAKLAALTKSYAEKHDVSMAKAEAAVLDTDEGNRLYTEAENEARAGQAQS